jgi:hypothetical protein
MRPPRAHRGSLDRVCRLPGVIEQPHTHFSSCGLSHPATSRADRVYPTSEDDCSGARSSRRMPFRDLSFRSVERLSPRMTFSQLSMQAACSGRGSTARPRSAQMKGAPNLRAQFFHGIRFACEAVPQAAIEALLRTRPMQMLVA